MRMSDVLSCPTAEVIEKGVGGIDEPQPDVAAIGIEGPGRDAAGRQQGPIAVDLHRAVRASTGSELIAGRKGDRDVRPILDPILGWMVGPDLDGMRKTIVEDVDQPGIGVGAALGFEDQALLIAGGCIDL